MRVLVHAAQTTVPPMPLRIVVTVGALLVGLLLAAPAQAAREVVVPNLAGDVKAFALSGDAVVVARRPPGRALLVERYERDGRRTELLRTRLDRDDDEVRLAASPQGLAVALQEGSEVEAEDSDDLFGSSRVLVGPATGPLREVAACETALTPAAIRVEGTRVGWGEGACGVPVDRPRGPSEASVVLGSIDAAMPVRRLPVGEDRIPFALTLAGERGVLGLLRPTLFAFVGGDLQRVGPDGLGRSFARTGDFTTPLGTFPGGATLLLREFGTFFDEDDTPVCEGRLETLPPEGEAARPVPLGACLAEPPDEDGTLTLGAEFEPPTVAGDRLAALTFVRTARQRSRSLERDAVSETEEPVTLVTARPDGGDRRVIARGGRYRRPEFITGAPGRVAWRQPRCGGGTEIVAADPLGPGAESKLIPSCRADLRTRTARVRGGAIRVRLDCPRGCKGRILDRTVCTGQRQRTFRLGPGVHSLRLPLSRAARRRGRALLQLRVESGPDRIRSVRLRG